MHCFFVKLNRFIIITLFCISISEIVICFIKFGIYFNGFIQAFYCILHIAHFIII